MKSKIKIPKPKYYLIKDFRATSFTKAFILNSLATALIVIIAILSKQLLDKHVGHLNDSLRITMTFFITFFSALIIYFVLYFIVGFGGGMIA